MATNIVAKLQLIVKIKEKQNTNNNISNKVLAIPARPERNNGPITAVEKNPLK